MFVVYFSMPCWRYWIKSYPAVVHLLYASVQTWIMKCAASRSLISGWNLFLRLPIGSPLLKQGNPLSSIICTVLMIPSMYRRAAKYPLTHKLFYAEKTYDYLSGNKKRGLWESFYDFFYLTNWCHVLLFITPDGSSNWVISWLSLKWALSNRMFPPGEVSNMKPKSMWTSLPTLH